MSDKPKNLIEGLQEQIDRVTKISTEYKKYPGGALAAGFMDHDISSAKEAIAHGDTIGMMRIYKKLEEWEL